MPKTKIEWTRGEDGAQGHSWNPIRDSLSVARNPKTPHLRGTYCTKVSPGCDRCYASDMNHRFYGRKYEYHKRPYSPTIDIPMCAAPVLIKKPTRFFVCSITDLFHEDHPFEMIDQLFCVMALCQQHQFMVLTKRPKRMKEYIESDRTEELYIYDSTYSDFPLAVPAWPLPNVWLMVTAENQEQANIRIPILLSTPAAIRGVSFEPLLGPIFLGACGAVQPYRPGYTPGQPVILDGSPFPQIEFKGLIDWAIIGGESGPKARPMNPAWVRDLVWQLQEAKIATFFKQWGEHEYLDYYCEDDDLRERFIDRPGVKVIGPFGEELDEERDGQPLHGSVFCKRVGKKAAGRILDGRTWDEMPLLRPSTWSIEQIQAMKKSLGPDAFRREYENILPDEPEVKK